MPPRPVTAPADDSPMRERGGAGGRIDRRMLIDGELAEAASAQRLPSVNPATGKILGFAPDCTVVDAQRAVAAARRSFDTSTWSTDIALRVRCLNQLHAALVENREDLRELAVAETGATWRLTEGPYLDAPIGMVRPRRITEVLPDDRTARRGTEHGSEGAALGREGAGRRGGDSHRCQPPDTNGAHSSRSSASSRLHGSAQRRLRNCTDHACTRRVDRQLHRYPRRGGQRAELVGSRSGPGARDGSGSRCASHFTGSISAARLLMAAASGTAKQISCRPERKSAAIVLDDADFSMCAAQVALMTTSHAGQGSAPISRLLVPRGHCDEMVTAVGKSLAAVHYGDPADSRTWMGPLISDRRRDEVDGMVKRAVAAGATSLRALTRCGPDTSTSPPCSLASIQRARCWMWRPGAGRNPLSR